MVQEVERMKGCGELIPVDPSDKASEGWYCGHYYDSYKKKIYCSNCSPNLNSAKVEE